MKISVVICTYNGSRYIRRQLESIINQTIKPDEIIVSDDNSTDETLSIVETVFNKFNYSSYVIVQNHEQLGVAKNFLSALKQVKGDFIFLSDQDDVWKPNKIEEFCKVFSIQKSDVIFSDGDLINTDEDNTFGSLWEAIPFNVDMLKKNTLFELMLKRSIVTGSAMAVSKNLVERIRSIENTPAGWIHDDFLGMLAAMNDSITPLPVKTYGYRQHESNVVGAKKISIIQKIRKWFLSIPKMKEERNRKYEKMSSMLEYCPLNKKANMEACVEFWKQMCLLTEKNKLESIKIVLYNRKRYIQYYTGIRGMIKDIFSLFVI